MKKQINQTISNIRNYRFIILLSGFFLFNSFTSKIFAQESLKKDTSPLMVKYLGDKDGQLLFVVEFDNKNEDGYKVSLKDQSGYVFFKEQFKNKKFIKKFRIDRNELGDQNLLFTLSNDKEKQAQVYQINMRTSIVEDLVVKKL